MATPIFFLCFANDEQQSLTNLNRESASIYELLMPADSGGRIQLNRESFANINAIGSYLRTYKNRISLFHYGGHADNRQLFFNDEAAFAEGLTYQLRQQKKLKLVFLNGCSTYGQVEALLSIGVPIVIATSTPIGDESATEFAINFYKAVAANDTVEDAFKHAAGIHFTKTGNRPEIHRGLGRKDRGTASIPWGLYHFGNERVLKQQLVPKPKISNFFQISLFITLILSFLVLFALFVPPINEWLFSKENGGTDMPKAVIDTVETDSAKEGVTIPASEPKSTDHTPIVKEKLFFSGLIKTYNDDALPIEGVKISGGGGNATTDENGHFYLPISNNSKRGILINFSKEGFETKIELFDNFPIQDQLIYLKIKN